MAIRITLPSYNPKLGAAKLDDNESYVCNTNIKLNPFATGKLVQQAKKHYRTSERSSLQFAADLRRLHDARVHKRGSGSKDFGLWCVDTFDGITRTNARQLAWQGIVLLILEGHGYIDIDDPKPRIGATGVRKLSSLLSKFDEQTLLAVWEQIEMDKPKGKIVEADVIDAMKSSGTFFLHQAKTDAANTNVIIPDYEGDKNDDENSGAWSPPETLDVDDTDVEAIVHLHQELVDSFDKKRRKLIKLTDPDNQPYDPAVIRKLYDEMATMLFELGNMLELEEAT